MDIFSNVLSDDERKDIVNCTKGRAKDFPAFSLRILLTSKQNDKTYLFRNTCYRVLETLLHRDGQVFVSTCNEWSCLMQYEIISSGNILLAGPEFETPLLVVMNLTLNCYGAVANIFIGNIQRSRLDHINIYRKEMLKVIKTFFN